MDGAGDNAITLSAASISLAGALIISIYIQLAEELINQGVRMGLFNNHRMRSKASERFLQTRARWIFALIILEDLRKM
jgi:hypothetical protein